MVWHMVSGVLLLMAAGFGVATRAGSRGALLAFTALAATFAVAGLVSALATGAGFSVLPQGVPFVPVTLLGLWAARPLGDSRPA